MADLKISQLTSATTPLAGTEVLPIVQSSSTKKVATDDLTVKNVRSNATTGILQIAGPAAAATRVMTVPDANFTAARTDAANSFTGDQTLSTGNLIQGTAAKGVNFTANTGAAGKTSSLLNWYEEGTFTPTITFGGGSTGITYGSQVGGYTRIGQLVVVTVFISLSNKGSSTGQVKVAGLPFTVKNVGSQYWFGSVYASNMSGLSSNGLVSLALPNTTTLALDYMNGNNMNDMDNTFFTNTSVIGVTVSYITG